MPSTLSAQLRDFGISPSSVLRRAGLPIGFLDQNQIWMTTDERFAFYKAIQEICPDPGIGLKLGSEDRVERYNPISITALYSRSFGDALGRIARYKRLTGPQEIRLEDQGDEVVAEFVWLLTHQEVPAIQIDTCFAWLMTIGRRGTRRELRPLRINFQRPETHRELYESHFGCPVRFGMCKDQIVFSNEDLKRPFQSYNPELLEMVAPQLEQELMRQLDDHSFSTQVKGVIKTLAAGQRPRLEDVAADLRMSTRTLQRRLKEDGLNFHTLLEESRRELSQHYLLHSELELSEVAYLVGYEDPNSFSRAFRKWEGTSPGGWRTLAKCQSG